MTEVTSSAKRVRDSIEEESPADRLIRNMRSSFGHIHQFKSVEDLMRAVGPFAAAISLARSLSFSTTSKITVVPEFLSAVRDQQHFVTGMIFEGYFLNDQQTLKLRALISADQSGCAGLISIGPTYLLLPHIQVTRDMVYVQPSMSYSVSALDNAPQMATLFLSVLPIEIYSTAVFRDLLSTLVSYLSSLKNTTEMSFTWGSVFISEDFKTSVSNATKALDDDGLKGNDKNLLRAFLGASLSSLTASEAAIVACAARPHHSAGIFQRSQHCLPLRHVDKHLLSEKNTATPLVVKRISELAEGDKVVLSDTKPSLEMITCLTNETTVQILPETGIAYEVLGTGQKQRFHEKKELKWMEGGSLQALVDSVLQGQGNPKKRKAEEPQVAGAVGNLGVLVGEI